MADVFTKEKRSEIMSRVRGKENKATELRLIALFREHGFKGWRRNYPLFGKPDFVFPAEGVAVFVDGEFWHGHPTRAKIPEDNRKFWEAKIKRNKARDLQVNRTLRQKGWTVVRIWQYQLENGNWKKKLAAAIYRTRDMKTKSKKSPTKKTPAKKVYILRQRPRSGETPKVAGIRSEDIERLKAL